ncbi:uncharacterized protein SPPG_02574 [Spizellomyces punctatus DAOM BR117]|uniref:Uncharacterized protein n=1 Tax=Spizellomyces punctatus (strain DAOM BR117) TaxID=645134 RepID=A0A0L0HKX5_SPIPD|nr:uncharacterized protein SPPG_02574 [Spizellomyces punctatus DAOM BR117]KND02071.1 hypothetical protein SPPG_02574 [Spizellomyces punctatus DAOM BR117]|eukprot:XP_016610110.1 hypothetical protein SPPG_02574 [Spizellomyces punctatus DAOM BR117]
MLSGPWNSLPVSMTFNAVTLALGTANIIYTTWGYSRSRTRGALCAAVSQYVMLLSYIASTMNDLHHFRTYNHAFRIGTVVSELTLNTGSFLLLQVILWLLPAVQTMMRYNVRWNTAAIIVTYSLYAVSTLGIIIVAAAGDKFGSVGEDAGGILFAVWAAYAPLMGVAIPILAIRLLVALKKELAQSGVMTRMDASTEKQTNIVEYTKKLDTIFRCLFGATCFWIPLTVGAAIATTTPFSIVIDAVLTCSGFSAAFVSYSTLPEILHLPVTRKPHSPPQCRASPQILRGLQEQIKRLFCRGYNDWEINKGRWKEMRA